MRLGTPKVRRQNLAITTGFENLGKQGGECYGGVDMALSRLEEVLPEVGLDDFFQARLLAEFKMLPAERCAKALLFIVAKNN